MCLCYFTFTDILQISICSIIDLSSQIAVRGHQDTGTGVVVAIFLKLQYQNK